MRKAAAQHCTTLWHPDPRSCGAWPEPPSSAEHQPTWSGQRPPGAVSVADNGRRGGREGGGATESGGLSQPRGSAPAGRSHPGRGAELGGGESRRGDPSSLRPRPAPPELAPLPPHLPGASNPSYSPLAGGGRNGGSPLEKTPEAPSRERGMSPANSFSFSFVFSFLKKGVAKIKMRADKFYLRAWINIWPRGARGMGRERQTQPGQVSSLLRAGVARCARARLWRDRHRTWAAETMIFTSSSVFIGMGLRYSGPL